MKDYFIYGKQVKVYCRRLKDVEEIYTGEYFNEGQDFIWIGQDGLMVMLPKKYITLIQEIVS